MMYKRIFAAVTALCLLMCGCGDVKNLEESSSESQEAQPLDESTENGDTLTTYVRAEDIPMPDSVSWFSNYAPTKDGFMCTGGSFDSDETHILSYHPDSIGWVDMVLVQPAPYDGYHYRGGLFDLGEDAYYCLAIMENHNNIDPHSDSPENIDWEAYNESWKSEYYLCTYEAGNGTLSDKTKIQGLEAYKDWQGYDQFYDFFCDGEHAYLTMRTGALLRIEADGTLTEIIPENDELDNNYHSEFLRDRDNKPIYLDQTESYDDEGFGITIMKLCKFDAETGKVGEPFYTHEGRGIANINIMPGGYGDHRLFVTETDEESGNMLTYGIRDDGTKEAVIDWEASNLAAMDVIPMKDGTFIGEDDYAKVYKITRKYASEMKEKQVVTVGILGYYDADFIHEFNNTNEDYKIKPVTYHNSDGSYIGDPNGSNDALEKLKLDVVSDDAPDMIFMGGMYDMDFHDTFLRLGSRGVFCDLYEFMDSDPDVNRDTVLPNILKAMEHPNGSLYSFTQGFTVHSIAVKSKFTDKENWTLDDMIDLYDGADDIMYYWSTKQDTLKLLLTGTSFTDEVNGTCNFDSPEFVKMLEFCNRYPLVSNQPEKNYDDPYQMQKHQQWYYDSFMRYNNDTDYIYFAELSAFTGGFLASKYAYTKGELGGDFTFVGYPSDNGNGGKITAEYEFGILSNCSNKDGAWAVVKSYLGSQRFYKESYRSGYSVMNEDFEELLDNEMYIYNMGNRSSDEYYDDDVRVYPLTQEERDNYEEYIRNCDTYMMLDEKVKNIVYEEADIYFNGEKSAEETAKVIQSRAEIYLSEQS